MELDRKEARGFARGVAVMRALLIGRCQQVGSGRADGYEFAKWIEAEPLPRFQDHAETSESDTDTAGRTAKRSSELAPAVEWTIKARRVGTSND